MSHKTHFWCEKCRRLTYHCFHEGAKEGYCQHCYTKREVVLTPYKPLRRPDLERKTVQMARAGQLPQSTIEYFGIDITLDEDAMLDQLFTLGDT